MSALEKHDPEVFGLIKQEEKRQHDKIRLIASENYVSQGVLEATGSVLTNKYSEGYAGRRYYEGQENIDVLERLAAERIETLFGVDHANVQPYSGSPANQAAYLALCELGDTVMGQSLPMGGHLSHGWKVNFSGILYDAHQYPVDRKTERLDFAVIQKMAEEVKPKVIFCGATAYPRIIEFDKFAEIAKRVGAYLVADIAHIAGLVAAGVHPSPAPFADVITSTAHKTLRGPRAGMIMCKEEHAKAVDRAVFPRLQGGPHNHTTAAIAVAAKEASTDAFKTYAETIVANAKQLAARLVEHGFRLVTGGTDNHLLLVDLTPIGVRGRKAARALNNAGVVTNSNTIPYDTAKPFNPSGLRLGAAAITSRGLKPEHMGRIAEWIALVLKNVEDENLIERTAGDVKEFLKDFPAPGLEHV